MKQVLGKINDDIIKKWHLDDYKYKNIVFYEERKKHIEKHKIQYTNEFEYYNVLNNLNNIIKNPDYVYYDVDKKGLEYYKKIKNNVLVAIRIAQGFELKIKSIYPVTDKKIENRKKKEQEALQKALIQKYKHKEKI